MRIVGMSSEPNNQNITINFSYNEIRDITNGLYYASQEIRDNDRNYEYIHAQMKVMFDMIKHGNIQPETINKLYKGEK